MVQPLDLHLVNEGSIPTGPTGRLQPHPGDVLKSNLNVRKSPRWGLNLEGRLNDPSFGEFDWSILQLLLWGATRAWEAGEAHWEWLYTKISEWLIFCNWSKDHFCLSETNTYCRTVCVKPLTLCVCILYNLQFIYFLHFIYFLAHHTALPEWNTCGEGAGDLRPASVGCEDGRWPGWSKTWGKWEFFCNNIVINTCFTIIEIMRKWRCVIMVLSSRQVSFALYMNSWFLIVSCHLPPNSIVYIMHSAPIDAERRRVSCLFVVDQVSLHT